MSEYMEITPEIKKAMEFLLDELDKNPDTPLEEMEDEIETLGAVICPEQFMFNGKT